MSGRTLNGLNATNVYVNSMFADGEAITITQVSNTTQAKVDLDISKQDTNSSPSSSDWFVIEENSGGSIKKISYGNLTSTFATLTGTQTLKNKTMELPFSIFDTSKDHKYVFAVSELTGSNKTITLPLLLSNDTFVFQNHIQTLVGKTLTTPIISDLNKTSSGYTMNVPAPQSSGDTLALLNTPQTMFSKTLSTSCAWNGNVIAYNYGGTGQSSWTKGDLLYASADNTLAKLSIGAQGKVLKVSSSNLPAWDTDTDTNFFTRSSPNVYVTNASDNLLVGTSSNGVSAKLYVDGDAYLVGDEIVITGEKNSTGSTSTAFTLNGKSYVASSTSMTAYTEMIKLVNPQKSGSADKHPTLQLKAGHLELRGTETDGSTRIDCLSINAQFFNATSGAVEDYDDLINVLSPVAGGSTNYPKLQFKLDNTNGSDGQVITCNSSGHCSWQTPATSQWTLSSSSLYPLSTATNVLVGTTSNSSSRKIMCNGAFEATGIVVGSFSGANSFSFIDGKFYNDANRTLYLDHNANQYGYGQRGIDSGGSTYSDVYTYTQSSGTAISSIGSYSNCRFALYSNQIDFLCSVPSSRGWITMGQAIAVTDSHTPLAQLHIENDLSNMNSGDTRILIKSKSSNHDSSILFSVNDATDGTGSYVETEVYGDSNGDLNLRGAEVKVRDNSATEKFRFSSNTNIAIATTLATTITPPTTQGNTALAGVQIAGGNGSAIAQRWAGASGADGTRYYMCNFIPPYHTGGPWGFWTEDDGSASNFGLSYGSTFLWYVNSSSSLVGASTWTGSDERIKEDIVNADTTECMNIIKRLPLKKYKYKQVLRDKCSGFTQSEVFGWVAQDIKADPVMNYASQTTIDTKYYDKETNSNLEYEVKDLEIINKSSLNAVSWGAISGLIDLVEAQQTKINTLEDELESIKVILENNNLV